MAFSSGIEAVLIDIVLAHWASPDAIDSGNPDLFLDSRFAKSGPRTSFLVIEAWKIQLHIWTVFSAYIMPSTKPKTLHLVE